MDYLKFLGLTVLAVIAIGLDAKLMGANIGLFVVIGGTIGAFIIMGPTRYYIAYIAWLVTLSLWSMAVEKFLHGFVDHQKHSQQAISTAIGLWGIVGTILLHPACYGFGRWASSFWGNVVGQDVSAARIGTAKIVGLWGRRYFVNRFAVIVLLVLAAGELAEHLLNIPRKPYEYYVVLCALFSGIIFLAYALRKNVAAARSLS